MALEVAILLPDKPEARKTSNSDSMMFSGVGKFD
jgi:hypothetical protein